LADEDSNTNGWKEWSKYVIKELERQGKVDVSQEEKIMSLRIDLEKVSTQLKERGAVWGFLAGIGAAIVIELVLFFAKNIF
jgi:hypothetical protein